MSEHDEQTKLFRLLALVEDRHQGIKWIHAIPNGGRRHPATAKKMKDEGVKPGISDVFVPVPKYTYDGEEFCGFYIEMKYGKNKPTEEQAEFLTHAELNGYATEVCYTAEDAFQKIMKYLEVDVSDMEFN